MACIAWGGELGSAPYVAVAEILVCADCRVELEGMIVAPLTMDRTPKVGEEWRE